MPNNPLSLPYISIAKALKIVGIIAVILGFSGPMLAMLVFKATGHDFSIFNTYLSDFGSTSGVTAIIFNTSMILSAPIRFLVNVLLVLRLAQLGATRSFSIFFLIISLIATSCMVVVSAAPYDTYPQMHNVGIYLFFPGTVLLQIFLYFQEKKIPEVPNLAKWTSLSVLISHFIFALLIFLMHHDLLHQHTPVIWEWISYVTQLVWILTHSILLGKKQE